MLEIFNNYMEISTNYNKNQIAKSAETMIKLTTYYEIYKIIMNIVVPIVIIIGIVVICYKLKKLNKQIEEQNENIEALVKLGIINNDRQN